MREITRAAMFLGLAWLLIASCGFGGEESTVRLWPESFGQDSLPKIERGTTPRIMTVPAGPLRKEANSDPEVLDLASGIVWRVTPRIVVPGIEEGTTPRIAIIPGPLRKEVYIGPQYRDLLFRGDPSRMWQSPWKKEAIPEPWVQDLLLRRIVPPGPVGHDILVPSGKLSDLVDSEQLK